MKVDGTTVAYYIVHIFPFNNSMGTTFYDMCYVSSVNSIGFIDWFYLFSSKMFYGLIRPVKKLRNGVMCMPGGSMKKFRKQRIRQRLKEQKASKITNELKEQIVNMSEEQQDELAQAIADIANEEAEEENK